MRAWEAPVRVCSPARIGYSSETRVILVGGFASAGGDHADVAQLVEHHLAKVRVAGSNPVVRSEAPDAVHAAEGLHGSREPFLSWRRGRKRRSGRVA